jgi:hypothetical protein
MMDDVDTRLFHGFQRVRMTAIEADQDAQSKPVDIPRWEQLAGRESTGLFWSGRVMLAVLAQVSFRADQDLCDMMFVAVPFDMIGSSARKLPAMDNVTTHKVNDSLEYDAG